MNSLRRFFGIGLVASLILLSFQPALAHTDIVKSSPASNSQLSELPKSVSITFSEELLVLSDKETSSISITNEAGGRVDDGLSTVNGSELSVGLKEPDGSGTFTVHWRAVAQDGHPVEGSYSFIVAPPPTPSPASVESTSDPVQSVQPSPSSTSTESDVSTDNAFSYLQVLLLGLLVLAGLAIFVLRWRRSDSE